MLRIWLIQSGEPLPTDPSVKKMRTALLAEKLAERGHKVTWFTSAFDHIKKEWINPGDGELEVSPELKFVFLKGRGYRRNISFERFWDHRIVSQKFYEKAKTMSPPDIILASLPAHDLACRAVTYAHENNIPVLVDVRDPWPDIFLQHLPGFIKPVIKKLLSNDFNKTRFALHNADGIISVTENFMKWAMEYAGRKQNAKDRIFSIGYKKLPAINETLVNTEFYKLRDQCKGKFIIFFVGTFSKSYHNPMILLEVARLLKSNEQIHFVIAGDGELAAEISRKAKDLDNVTLPGWLNQHEIEFWLKCSKIGVCPAAKAVDLPTNKAYAYLSAGLPLVSAFGGELKELIEKYSLGINYTPGDADGLCRAIEKLYNDKKYYAELSENASRIFNEKFDAEKIYMEYAEHLEKVALHQT